MDWSAVLANLGFAVLLLAGLGLTLVGLLGNWLVMGLALFYGYWEGFQHFHAKLLLVLFGLALAGEVAEFTAGAIGARKAKASRAATAAAMAGAFAGGIAGTALLPVVGTLFGAMAGAYGASYLAEYVRTNDAAQAGRVARQVMLGQLAGTLFKLAAGVVMVILAIINLPW